MLAWLRLLVLMATAYGSLAAATPVPVVPAAVMAGDPEDEALLRRSVTVSWMGALPGEAITALNAALAPGPQLWSVQHAVALQGRRTSEAFANAPVDRVLDALTPPGDVWVLRHRHLTVVRRLPPEPGVGGRSAHWMWSGSRATLREQLLAWARSPTDAALAAMFPAVDLRNATLDSWNQVPIAAFALDQRVVAAVAPALSRLLAGTEPPSLNALAIAAALGIPSLVPAERAQLAAIADLLHRDPDHAAHDATIWFMRALLAQGLGMARDEASVPALLTVARSLVGRNEQMGDAEEPISFDRPTLRTDASAPMHASVQCVISAIDALARIDTPSAHAALGAILADGRPWAFAWIAARDLARIGATDLLPAVRAAFDRACTTQAMAHWLDPGFADGEVVATARALAQLGGPMGVQCVLDELARTPLLASSLLWALEDVRDPTMIPVLLDLAEQDDPVVVRDHESLRQHMPMLPVLGTTGAMALVVQPGADQAILDRLQACPDASSPRAQILWTLLGATGSARALTVLMAQVAPAGPGLLTSHLVRRPSFRPLRRAQQLPCRCGRSLPTRSDRPEAWTRGWSSWPSLPRIRVRRSVSRHSML